MINRIVRSELRKSHGDGSPERSGLERLAQNGFVAKSIRETFIAISAGEHKGNATLAQNVCDGKRSRAGDIDVEHGEVDIFRAGKLDRILNAAARADHMMAHVGQQVFKMQGN